MLDLKKMDVRKVPQIDNPQQHLSEAGRRDCKSSPPGFEVRDQLKAASEAEESGNSPKSK